MNSYADAKHLALDEFTRAESAALVIRMQLSQKPQLGAPEIAVVLGSGLGAFAEELKDSVVIPYGDIPNFPRPTAIGHAGRMVIGKLGDLTVAAMQGRAHQYEGYSSRETAFPVRVLGQLGVKTLVITNAAGGINPDYKKGALVLLSDHINLQGSNPLNGPNDDRFGVRFPDMSEAYCRNYRRIALNAARQLGIELQEGIYAALPGPSYETPAEIRYLRTIGADMVGMSTVPEVIVARHMGINVLAISCVTNMAAGLFEGHINHDEVLETGARVRDTICSLLTSVLPALVSESK
ncbi:MAG: purine-nucleoside phosphorylase [Acidobacteria bacterium]|nr:MAG: purine-nucleoside phosphorylase [Acidobacteriota bacterium]